MSILIFMVGAYILMNHDSSKSNKITTLAFAAGSLFVVWLGGKVLDYFYTKIFSNEVQKNTLQEYFKGQWKSKFTINGYPESGTGLIEIKNKIQWWENGAHLWNIEDFKVIDNQITFTKVDNTSRIRTKFNHLKIVERGEKYTGQENIDTQIEYSKIFKPSIFKDEKKIETLNICLEITNCSATKNLIEFDILINNKSLTTLRYNACIIRLTHSKNIISKIGANQIQFGFINDNLSSFPNSFPPINNPAFIYTNSVYQCSVSTGTGIYTNNTNPNSPEIASGQTRKIGRFYLKNVTNEFVGGSILELKWIKSSAVIFFVNGFSTTVSTNNIDRIFIDSREIRIPLD